MHVSRDISQVMSESHVAAVEKEPLVLNEPSSNSRSKRVQLVQPAADESSATRRLRAQSVVDEDIDHVKELREQNATFWQKYNGAIKVGVFAFLLSLSALTVPFLPERKKDYFGSDKKAALVQSIIDCITALLGLLLASIYGKLCDRYGRRPFFLLLSVVNSLTAASLVLFPNNILITMIVGGLASLVQQSFLFAWLADVYSSKMRMQVVAIISAVSSFSAIFMITTAFVKFHLMSYICLGASALAIAFAFFFIEETLPIERRIKLTSSDVLHNPFAAIIALAKSKVAAGLTAILFFFGVAQVGTGDIYMFYLNERIGFTAVDNAYLVCLAGIIEPFFFLVVLPRALRILSPNMMILATLCFLIIELVTIATLWAKWAAFAFGIPVVSFVNLLSPVVFGLLQNTCKASELGQRMAGVQATMDLASAIGPLFFGLLYGNLKNALMFLPFVVCAGLAIPPILIALRLTKWMAEEIGEVAEPAGEA